MAPVNPQVPQTPDPFYLHLSKPAAEPTPDKSRGEAFQTLGKALSETAEATDTGIKNIVLKPELDKLQNVDDENIASLESDKNAVTDAKSYGQAEDNTDVLTAQGTASVPSSVSQGIKSVQIHQEARDNGKITETQTLGKQYQILKDLRTQWPMYRDYIDRQSEKITGKNIANSYRNSLIADLNATQTAKQKELEEVDAQFRHLENEGIGGVALASYHNQFRSGQRSIPEAREFIANNTAFMGIHKQRQYASEEEGYGVESEKRNAPPMMDGLIGQASLTHANSLFTPKNQVEDIIGKFGRGETIDPKLVLQATQEVAAQEQAYRTDVMKDLNNPRNGINGKSLATILGPDETNKRIEAGAEYFRGRQRLLTSGDYSAIHNLDNAMKATQTQNKFSLLNNKDFGPMLQMNEALGASAPQFVKELNTQFAKQKLDGGGGLQTLFEKTALEMFTGAPSAKPLAQTIDDVARSNEISDKSKGKFSHQMISMVEKLADPKTPDAEAANIANKTYDSRNLGIVSKFEKSNGDNLSIFGRLTDPTMLQRVWQLSGQNPGNPLWQKAKNFAEQSFGKEIFDDNLRQLVAEQNILMKPSPFAGGDTANLAKRRNFSIGWDTAAHELRVDAPNDPMFDGVRKNINRINYGLHNIKSIAETEGSDVNSYLLNRLQQFGVHTDPLVTGIYNSIAKQKENEENFRRMAKEKYQKRE